MNNTTPTNQSPQAKKFAKLVAEYVALTGNEAPAFDKKHEAKFTYAVKTRIIKRLMVSFTQCQF